jgi:hypothetical protein
MDDSVLDDCMVILIEKDTFVKINDDDIIETFMAMRKRYPQKNK